MRNTIKRIVEFIKFVIGSTLMGVGVFVGGIANFVAKICYRAVRAGLIMASDLRSRYLEMSDYVIVDNVEKLDDVVQEKGST